MKLNKKTRFLAVGALSAAMLAGAAVASATAAVQGNGSDGPITIFTDGGEFNDAPGHVYTWNEGIIASVDPVDPMNGEFACPVGASGAYTFMTDPGTERTGTDGWKSFKLDAVTPTNGVFLPNITAENQLNGQSALIKATGGTYSLGLACTIDNGVNVVAAYYRTATVTAGTGAYTLAPVDTEVVVTPPPAGTTGDITLSPTTMDVVNGTLGLSVPAGAAATFGAPTLVGNKSTTTGTLPEVTVVDGRVVTAEGWTLNAIVKPFVNASNALDTIAPDALTIAPKVVAAGTNSQGAVAGAEFTGVDAPTPGSSVFAEAAAGQGTESTVLGGDLTFVAPQSKAAGTYNSTLTLTVVSK